MDFVTAILSGAQLSIVNERTGLPVWNKIYPINAAITAPNETSEFPLAGNELQIVSTTGNSTATNVQAAKVIMPTHLSIQLVCTDQSTIESIVDLFSDDELTFSITTRNIIAKGMSVSDTEILQDSENINGSKITITFEQTSISSQASFDPRQESDKSSNGISVKEPQGLTKTLSSVYNKVKSTVGI